MTPALSAWVLVLFLSTGYRGGVVAIDMPNEASCRLALETVKIQATATDAFCIRRDVMR